MSMVLIDEATALRVSTWSMVITVVNYESVGNVGAKPGPVCSTASW